MMQQWIHDIRSLNIEKGFVDPGKPRALHKLKLLLLTEIAETVEELRAKEFVYWSYETDKYGQQKPIGYASEIIDIIYRYIDMLGEMGRSGSLLPQYEEFSEDLSSVWENLDWPDAENLHTLDDPIDYVEAALLLVAEQIIGLDPSIHEDTLCGINDSIFVILYTCLLLFIPKPFKSVSFLDLLKEKYEYNKTRPHKNGKAF